MIRLEATAAPDISDPKLEGLPGELVNVKPGADPGLQGEWKLREVDESLLSSVRGAVAKRLQEQEGGQTCSLQASLHPPDALQRYEGVEVAVDADDAGARLVHPDSTVPSRDPVHVPLGSDTHTGSNSLSSIFADFNCPFHLFDMFEVLKLNKKMLYL